MHMFDQEQRFLLKGIARLSAQIHTIDDADVFSLADDRRRVVLKRAIKALLHDAAQVEVALQGYTRHCWHSAVKEATTPRNALQERAYVEVWTNGAHPHSESVERNLTLPGKE